MGADTVQIRVFDDADEDQVVTLWEQAGLTRAWNNPHLDIERKRSVQPELFLVAECEGQIVGSVMAGYDGHRGWLSYLATAKEHRGEGIGGALVEEAEQRLRALGCPKVQLMVRPENEAVQGFYASLGYEPFVVWTTGKRLIADS